MIGLVRFIVLIFILGGLIAWGFSSSNGYVLLRYGDYQLQTSLLFFVVALIIAIFIVYAIIRLLVGGIRLPWRLGAWRRRRRQARARDSLTVGLLDFWQGRWQKAENELSRHAAKAELPVANHLAAASVAHLQRAYRRRDEHLGKAYRAESGAAVATLLTQARLELEQGQYARSQATLKRLGQVAQKDPYVTALHAQLYRHLGDWEQLRRLLPQLDRRSSPLTDEQRQEMAVEAYTGLLESQSVGRDAARLRGIWSDVPGDIKKNAKMVRTYAKQLGQAGEEGDAAELLADHLKKQWKPELALLYGQLDAGDTRRQLSAAESWLKRYGEKPELLLMAGLLCLRGRLWGRARSYLERSISARPSAEAYRALGDLHSQVDEKEAALEAYRQGLRLSEGGDNLPQALAGKARPAGEQGQPLEGQVTKA